jgi:hypothetical protein
MLCILYSDCIGTTEKAAAKKEKLKLSKFEQERLELIEGLMKRDLSKELAASPVASLFAKPPLVTPLSAGEKQPPTKDAEATTSTKTTVATTTTTEPSNVITTAPTATTVVNAPPPPPLIIEGN